jgi:hypothetical protein
MLNISASELRATPLWGADGLRFAVPLAASALLVLLTGCGGRARADDSTADTSAERAGADSRRSTDLLAAAPGAVELNGTPMPTPVPPRRTVRVADRLMQYLTRVLGEPSTPESLHRHIREVSVGLHVAAIHTDLSSGESDKAAAKRICRIASWFRKSPEGRHVTALDIEVYGHGGDLIAAYDETPHLGSVSDGSRDGSRMPRQDSSAIHPGGVVPSPTPGHSALDGAREAS